MSENTINDNDLDLKLLAGLPIQLSENLILHLPNIKEIISLNESVYQLYLSTLLFDKSRISGIEENVNDFDLLYAVCYQNEEFRDTCFKALEFIVKDKPTLDQDDINVFISFENLNSKLCSGNFSEFQAIIKKANYIKIDSEPEFKAGNSKAQEMIDLLTRNKKNRPKKKETMNLHSIISGISWKTNGSTMSDILNMTIYQLYNGFFYTENIDNYHNTFTGIYTGNIDGKNIDLPSIHWAKILEN